MLIGISGKKNHGKDTLAAVIQDCIIADKVEKGLINVVNSFFRLYEINETPKAHRARVSGWETKMFAGKLKEIVCLLIGCTMEQLEDQAFKEKLLGPEWTFYVSDWNTVLTLDEYNNEVRETQRHLYTRHTHTPRTLLQLLGTEAGRKLIHPNIWVNATFADFKPLDKIIREDTDGTLTVERRDTAIRGADGNWYIPALPHVPKEHHGKQIAHDAFQWCEVITVDQLRYPNWIITDCRFKNEAKAIKERSGLIFRIERLDIKSNDNHQSEIDLDDYQDFDEWIVNEKDNYEKLNDDVKQILIKHKIIQND